ncbi:MAG: bifunctional acyl-ACP--phospholipid O-acyltransferase/long-chain-fatty-acid--ACP ligase [Sulfuricaulis sp.]
MFKILLRALIKPLVRILFRLRVEGDTGQFQARRLLIIANHESFLDGLLLGLFLPVDPVFVVYTGVVKNIFFRLLLSQVEYLAVDPTSPMAMRQVIKLIEQGRPVMVFPEGRITVTGNMMKVYDGPAFVAAKTAARIIPVRLDGPARSYFSRLSGKYPRCLFPKITLSIQTATTLPMPEAPSAKIRRRKAGEAMRRIMQEMLFQSQPKQTLYTALVDAIEIFGRRRRLVEDITQIEYSYGKLLKMTLGAARLTAKYTHERENVGVLLPNLATTVALLIGLSARRRVPAMLNFMAGVEAMQNACVAANIRTILCSRQFIENAKLDATISALQGVRLIFLEDLRPYMSLADRLWVMFGLMFPRWAERRSNPEDPAVVLFTSGSEGKPKGVVLSHRAILSNIAQIRAIIDFSIDDKLLNALPMFHSFGLTGGTLLPILTGAKLFLYPTPLHYRVIPELAYDRGCTILFGTCTFLGNYAKFAHPYDFYRLRYVIAGAEKLTDSVRNLWFEKFGIRILEGYGATETAPVLAVNTPMAYRTGTVGQLLPAIEAKLIPVPGIERGGILHVRGPNVMSGYYCVEHPGRIEPPKAEAGTGWYNTGDIADIDADGFVTILGRVKRFAKVAGEMVSLEIAETIAVCASPAGQHGVSTQADERRGEALVLFTTDNTLTRERLQEVAKKSGHPEIAVPRKIIQVEALPRLGSGKVDYVTLKHMVGQTS